MLLEVCNADLQWKQKPRAGCVVVQSVPPLASFRQCLPHEEELFQMFCFALQSGAQHGGTGGLWALQCLNLLESSGQCKSFCCRFAPVVARFTPSLMRLESGWAESRPAQLTRELRHTQELQNELAEAGSRAEQCYRAWSQSLFIIYGSRNKSSFFPFFFFFSYIFRVLLNLCLL